MSGVKLKGASLRGSNIEGLAINAKDLEGVTIDPTQAAYLAPLFGVKVGLVKRGSNLITKIFLLSDKQGRCRVESLWSTSALLASQREGKFEMTLFC